MMCASHTISPRPSNAEKIDLLIQALEEAESSSNDGDRDPLCSLPSSLQEVYASFGIFDSLTLAERKASKRDSNEFIDLKDLALMPDWPDQEDEVEDKFDFAWRAFDSSWEDNVKASLPMAHSCSARRSGVRRGQQQQAIMGPDKIMVVPTKLYDGPSSDKFVSGLSHISSDAMNGVEKKQASPPAA